MSQVKDARFVCEVCEKAYRWKPELAGRRVKCACGAVMICPQRPGQQPVDDLYDLVSDDDSPAPGEDVAMGVSSCRNLVAAPAPIAKCAPFEYRRPRDEPGAMDRYFPDRVKDLYAPLWLILGSAVVQTIGVLIVLGGTGKSILWGLTALTAQMLIGTVLMLVGVMIAAKLREISFGPFWTAVLKLAAISIAPDCIRWVGGLFLYLIPTVGPILNWLIGFCIYFALFGALFDLDQDDTWYCVCVIFVVKLAVFFAIFSGVANALMRGG